MTMVFHGPDDEHAPFPHRVLIIKEKTVYITVSGTRVKRKVIRPRQKFVICSYCDHWIQRNIPTCDCPYQCHRIEEVLAGLASDDVDSNEQGSQEPVIREAAS